MDKARMCFSSGKYNECISEIMKLNSADPNTLLNDVNIGICRAHICLTDGGNHEEILNQLHTNYQLCISLGLPGDVFPLHVELVLMFNYNWWILANNINRCYDISIWNNSAKMLSSLYRRGEAQLVEHQQSEENHILDQLLLVKNEVMRKHRSSLGILLEYLSSIILVALLFSKDERSRQKCQEVIKQTLQDRREISALYSKEDCASNCNIFKFGFHRCNSNLSEIDIASSIERLSIIYNVIVQEPSRINSREKSSSQCRSLQNYCDAVNSFLRGENDKSLELLLVEMENVSIPPLQERYFCLLGQIYSSLGERHKAIEQYMKCNAKKLPIVHYYMGYEYGKMGLHDLMLKSYESLVKILKKSAVVTSSPFPMETRILEVIHGTCEISRHEAIYLLAVSYGLQERFDDAVLAFEKLMSPQYLCYLIVIIQSDDRRIIKLPKIVAIIHEAATMNLLTGNLQRCEDLCHQAINMYLHEDRSIDSNRLPDVHGTKDAIWIHNMLEEELGMHGLEFKEEVKYFEEYVGFFDEDVIGLLLLAETQRILEAEDERITLNQVLLILSKHIAKMQKEKDVSIEEDRWLTLVKALTAKTCLQIARMQVGAKPFADVDRMFKRALSCNDGDKDVLFHYATFLLDSRRIHDGQRLWNSFYNKSSKINLEECQSLALRHLLRKQISQRDLQLLGQRFKTV